MRKKFKPDAVGSTGKLRELKKRRGQGKLVWLANPVDWGVSELQYDAATNLPPKLLSLLRKQEWLGLTKTYDAGADIQEALNEQMDELIEAIKECYRNAKPSEDFDCLERQIEAVAECQQDSEMEIDWKHEQWNEDELYYIASHPVLFAEAMVASKMPNTSLVAALCGMEDEIGFRAVETYLLSLETVQEWEDDDPDSSGFYSYMQVVVELYYEHFWHRRLVFFRKDMGLLEANLKYLLDFAESCHDYVAFSFLQSCCYIGHDMVIAFGERLRKRLLERKDSIKYCLSEAIMKFIARCKENDIFNEVEYRKVFKEQLKLKKVLKI